jgi:adenosylcobinamide kinase/adenosylcobinamide-phosphate guanylyltransferase
MATIADMSDKKANSPMNRSHPVVLILGGARSGKSTYAQKLAERWWPRPLYLAPAETLDDEMADRVKLHQENRGSRWACVEETLDIAKIIKDSTPARDGVLLDCATLWLTNVLLKEGVAGIEARKRALIDALKTCPTGVIIVSNEVGMGIVPEYPLGRDFRDQQGWLNQELAAIADIVIFVIAGIPMFLKGTLPNVA